MRFVQPKKGFRLSKKLGLLLFYTAVVSGSLSSCNKACALEAPSLPPSVMMASANNGETNKVVKPSESKVLKAEKTSPVLPTSINTLSKASDKKIKEEPATPAQVEDSKPELTPAVPPSLLVNSVKSQNIVNDDYADDDFSIKGEESPKTSSNLIASAKIVENDVAPVATKAVKEKTSTVKTPVLVEKKAEINVSEKKDVQAKAIAETSVGNKAEAKTAEKTISNNSAKKDIVKSSSKASDKPVEMKKAEKIEVKEKIKSEVKKHSKVRRVTKKVRVDDSECPPEWDWFSAPLVFVRDANGKLVLMADKNAPKIVIGSNKISKEDVKVVRPVKVENKVVKTKKTVAKTVKKAEPEKAVEAKPFEAPAAPAVVVESKPVDEKIAEVKEETPAVSYNKPVIMIDTKKAEETKPLFAEASEKMARIKRLHTYDDKSENIEMASLRRSASMVRMHKLVVDLIKRTDSKSNKANKLMNTSVAPQAPPEATNNRKIADNSSNNSNNSGSEKYAFRPYYNPDFSSRMNLKSF